MIAGLFVSETKSVTKNYESEVMIMAYWINQSGNSTRPNWRQFYCDTDTDINNLPTSSRQGIKQEGDSSAHQSCSVGSECLVLDTTRVYILNSSDVWREIS